MRDMADPVEPPENDDDAPLRQMRLPTIEPPTDFLEGVQAKIRRRSGGKFYASRWGASPMATAIQIVSLVMLLVIALIWLLAGRVDDVRPERTAGGRAVKIEIRGPGSTE